MFDNLSEKDLTSLRRVIYTLFKEGQLFIVDCPECEGTGRVRTQKGFNFCNTCMGEGKTVDEAFW